MPVIASFLAGSLLSLLLPTIMLILLVVWYMAFLRRVPEPTDDQPVPNPSPTEGPELSGTAKHLD